MAEDSRRFRIFRIFLNSDMLKQHNVVEFVRRLSDTDRKASLAFESMVCRKYPEIYTCKIFSKSPEDLLVNVLAHSHRAVHDDIGSEQQGRGSLGVFSVADEDFQAVMFVSDSEIFPRLFSDEGFQRDFAIFFSIAFLGGATASDGADGMTHIGRLTEIESFETFCSMDDFAPPDPRNMLVTSELQGKQYSQPWFELIDKSVGHFREMRAQVERAFEDARYALGPRTFNNTKRTFALGFVCRVYGDVYKYVRKFHKFAFAQNKDTFGRYSRVLSKLCDFNERVRAMLPADNVVASVGRLMDIEEYFNSRGDVSSIRNIDVRLCIDMTSCMLERLSFLNVYAAFVVKRCLEATFGVCVFDVRKVENYEAPNSQDQPGEDEMAALHTHGFVDMGIESYLKYRLVKSCGPLVDYQMLSQLPDFFETPMDDFQLVARSRTFHEFIKHTKEARPPLNNICLKEKWAECDALPDFIEIQAEIDRTMPRASSSDTLSVPSD